MRKICILQHSNIRQKLPFIWKLNTIKICYGLHFTKHLYHLIRTINYTNLILIWNQEKICLLLKYKENYENHIFRLICQETKISFFHSLHSGKYIYDSFQIERNVIVVTVLFLIMNQTKFHSVHKQM